MKNTIVGMLLLGIIALTACGKVNTEQQSTESSQESDASVASEEVDVVESDEAEETVELEDEETQEEEADNGRNNYDGFLKNEDKVYGPESLYTYHRLDDETDNEKEYTLEELAQTVCEEDFSEYGNGEISKVKYAFVDCGKDGKEELLISVATKSEYDEYEHFIVIKKVNDRLNLVYSDASVYREVMSINEYGYIDNEGSGGAMSSSFTKSFIDADGIWHFLYRNNAYQMFFTDEYNDDIWFNNESHPISLSEPLDAGYVFFEFDATESVEDSYDNVFSYAAYDKEQEYDVFGPAKGYFFMELKEDESIYDTSNPIKQFFDREGLKIYPIKEVEKLIEGKEQREGLTEEVKNGQDPEWTEIQLG